MSHDVLIVGAGPAGSLVARRLAAAGARVALVGTAARPGWEGLSGRSAALLAEEGLEIDRPDSIITGPLARSGEWGAGRAVGGTEWLVERRTLAAALRDRACAAGADVRRDVVTQLDWKDGRWHCLLRDGGMLAASQVIEARGRRGPERRGPLLLAVGREFRRPRAGFLVSITQGTHLYPLDFGWCWWAVWGDAVWVQVVGRPVRASRPAPWIAAAAEQIPALGRALEGASAAGDLTVRPAHARLGRVAHGAARGAHCDVRRWRVGDAAVALDPLSGQGVYEALRGARLVATAVQSVMSGGDGRAAQRFVAERQEESWVRGVRAAGSFYRESGGRGSFWSDTAGAYERLLPSIAGAAAGATGAESAAGAESAGRAAGVARISGPAPRIERRPVLCDGRILEREVIVTPQHPRGVWHLAEVPLVTLKQYLESAEHASVSGAAAALDRPAAAVASAIHWLQQTGIVERPLRPGIPLGG